jgi:hypothetical protein
MLALFVTSVGFISAEGLSAATDANAREQLEFRGQQVAESIESVDRSVRGSASDNAIGKQVDLPEQAGGEEYTIVIQNDGGNQYSVLLLRDGEDNDFTARAFFRSETAVETGSVRGGTLQVARKEDESEITIEQTGTN